MHVSYLLCNQDSSGTRQLSQLKADPNLSLNLNLRFVYLQLLSFFAETSCRQLDTNHTGSCIDLPKSFNLVSSYQYL